MAKFAKVGYGSDGRGLGSTQDGYTYVVNDNVRTGDKLQPVATQWISKRKFVTTGVALHTYKQDSVKGVETEVQAQSQTGKKPTQIYTGKELGIEGFKGSKQYETQTRGGNLAEYIKKQGSADLTERAYETFDDYSKKYMKQEKKDE